MQTKPKIALIYDFDKTLSPKDMQAYGSIDKLGVSEDKFWDKCQDILKSINRLDNVNHCPYDLETLTQKDVLVDYYSKYNKNNQFF